MIRSPEIEAMIRRLLAATDEETELNILSTSQDFLAIGTDGSEWWRGRDALMNAGDAQWEELKENREDLITPETPMVQLTSVEAFESGTFGWGAAQSAMTASGEPLVMRSTFVLLLQAGTWRFIQIHHSIGVPNEELFGFEMTTSLDALVSSLEGESRETVAAAAPSGTATVMFTDIEDSTRLSQSIGDDAWAALVNAHFSTLRVIVEAEGGTVVKTLGDGGMFTFASARAGLTAAIKIQQSVSIRRDAEVAVRIGLHSGDVIHTEGDYVGVTVNKAARVAAAAQGGEIMASSVTAELAGQHGFEFGAPVVVMLKGIEGAQSMVPLVWDTA